jgi:hypothetical protein
VGKVPADARKFPEVEAPRLLADVLQSRAWDRPEYPVRAKVT